MAFGSFDVGPGEWNPCQKDVAGRYSAYRQHFSGNEPGFRHPFPSTSLGLSHQWIVIMVGVPAEWEAKLPTHWIANTMLLLNWGYVLVRCNWWTVWCLPEGPDLCFTTSPDRSGSQGLHGSAAGWDQHGHPLCQKPLWAAREASQRLSVIWDPCLVEKKMSSEVIHIGGRDVVVRKPGAFVFNKRITSTWPLFLYGRFPEAWSCFWTRALSPVQENQVMPVMPWNIWTWKLNCYQGGNDLCLHVEFRDSLCFLPASGDFTKLGARFGATGPPRCLAKGTIRRTNRTSSMWLPYWYQLHVFFFLFFFFPGESRTHSCHHWLHDGSFIKAQTCFGEVSR